MDLFGVGVTESEVQLAQKLVDDAKVALVQAQSQYETAQQHLKSLQTVGRTEQARSAQAQEAAAKAHYENAQAQVSYAAVRSPMNGGISESCMRRLGTDGDVGTVPSDIASLRRLRSSLTN